MTDSIILVFKIGDPVTYRDGAIETVVMGDPDVNGDIITVDESGVYIFRHQDALTPVPPPDPRDAVVEAAVALVAAAAIVDLADAVKAVPRHRYPDEKTGTCFRCFLPWPCPTERAHRALDALEADRA